MTALTQTLAVDRQTAVARIAPSKGADRLFQGAAYASALLVLFVLAGILGSIIYGAWPAFSEFGFGFLTSSAWNIGTEQFGALPAVIGTVAAAMLARSSACRSRSASRSTSRSSARAGRASRSP